MENRIRKNIISLGVEIANNIIIIIFFEGIAKEVGRSQLYKTNK